FPFSLYNFVRKITCSEPLFAT
ncbi:hypothetical protein CISIN_1g0417272mg, partial [Citrus sinensis]